MASTSNSNNVQSISLDLENLIQQYNNVLNFFNSVQAELDNYVNTPYPQNPYLNTNIQFTSGEICYVTKNGVAKLYQDIDGAYSLANDEQAITNDEQVITDDEQAISDGQQEVNLSSDETNLQNQLTQIASDQETLNTDGCPPISQVTQVNIAWLSQYNQPGQIIPTTPPLITGTPMTGTEVSQGLNCNDINAGNPPPPIDLTTIQNSSYTGGVLIGTVSALNSEECMTYCYTSPSCTGATYNSTNQTCSLSSGEGIITNSSTNNTAIVPQLVEYLDVMIVLNTQLTNINNQILNLTDQSQPIYNNLTLQTQQKKQQLNKTYNSLMAERDRIEKQVKDYESLQDDENYNYFLTNSNYLSYVLHVALAILVIIILMNIGGRKITTRQYGGGSLITSTYFVIFVIVISFLIYIFYSNKR